SQTTQSSPTPESAPDIAPEILTYLNRLSDYLFILARHLNHLNSIPDTPWLPRS
ncbi:MAG: ATP:cob(I)alamin adenosyltransferase, partial [Duncaniella sp.]|nr:ATP:cob(I)alamin adenosyltransferase [Duncaniella sp.]